MTKFEFLKNRYIVIGLYPGSKFAIGDILYYENYACHYRSKEHILEETSPSIDACNKVFRKLEWFEKTDLTKIKKFKHKDGRIITAVKYESGGIWLKYDIELDYKDFITYWFLEPIFDNE